MLFRSAEAQQEQQTELAQLNMQLQGKAAQYQQEMAQAQMGMTQKLAEELHVTAQSLGKEKGFELILDRAAVLYAADDVVDVTEQLIKRHDAK